MPEMPEVETVRRTLAPHLTGRRVRRVELLRPSQIRHPDPDTFVAALEGRRFAAPGRRGKYLLLHLDGGGMLVSHLRMSGRLFVVDPRVPRERHTHVVFHLDDGAELRYQDMRTFGGFHLVDADGRGLPPGLKGLGPEVLDAGWSADYLSACLGGGVDGDAHPRRPRRTAIKALLLDQTIVAGLGNIYVDETLFRAGVHPARPAGAVTPAEAAGIVAASRDVVSEAVAANGTTFSLYFDGEGRRGDYYSQLRVFGRRGEPCFCCGTPIVKARVAGRGTHFCPACQT